MQTKYIVNNLSGQTITGDLTISGKTSVLSSVPNSMLGSVGDKRGQLAFDNDYLYYCIDDYVSSIPPVVSGGGPTHVYDAEPGNSWNNYGSNYLQIGPTQGDPVTPQNGWYMVDDNGNTRQIIGGFWLSPEAPSPNGTGWIMTLDGPFNYSVANTTITLYETLPTVQAGIPGSGDIWKRTKLTEPLNDIVTYKCLLTQTGPINGTDINSFNGELILNETYTINSYSPNDDFSNIANVQSGIINESGCVFIATGTTPTNWSNGTQITSNGGLVVDEIENNLGYGLNWSWAPFGGQGTYLAFNDLVGGPYSNVFPKTKTQIFTQMSYAHNFDTTFDLITGVGSFMALNNLIKLDVLAWDTGFGIDNSLYYTPVEIKIQQDMNPFVINGTVNSSYPVDNVSVRTYCNGSTIDTYYGNMDNANNISELVTILNSDTDLNFLGTYSDDGNGNPLLIMTTHNKNLFCSNGLLTFEVFAD